MTFVRHTLCLSKNPGFGQRRNASLYYMDTVEPEMLDTRPGG